MQPQEGQTNESVGDGSDGDAMGRLMCEWPDGNVAVHIAFPGGALICEAHALPREDGGRIWLEPDYADPLGITEAKYAEYLAAKDLSDALGQRAGIAQAIREGWGDLGFGATLYSEHGPELISWEEALELWKQKCAILGLRLDYVIGLERPRGRPPKGP